MNFLRLILSASVHEFRESHRHCCIVGDLTIWAGVFEDFGCVKNLGCVKKLAAKLTSPLRLLNWSML